MKICTTCDMIQSLENFSKNKTTKDGYSYTCKACEKVRKAASYIANKHHITQKQKLARDMNPEKEKLRKQKYYANNKTKRLTAAKQYRDSNKERYLLQQKMYKTTYKGRITKAVAESKRREQKYNAATKLTTEEQHLIRCVYEFCAFKTKCTGIQHHVDHIKPLSKGGLHVLSNLQILTASDNLKKSNTWHE